MKIDSESTIAKNGAVFSALPVHCLSKL